MGADLILTTLWAKVGPERDATLTSHDGREYHYKTRDALIDWQKAHTAVRTLVDSWTEDELGVWAEYAAEDPDRDAAKTDLAAKVEALREVTDGGRDMDIRDYAPHPTKPGIRQFITGGMSHGDSPTDAFDVISAWWGGDEIPRGHEVLEAAGFITDVYERLTYLPPSP